MPEKKYDFAGWVTKNDIRCSDGVVIKHDAFKDNDQKKVPLVWNHNHSAPTNILGHMILHNQDKGIYGYGYLNESDEANHARSLIEHGDISAMSIGANKIKKQGANVIHGLIYEVSLVLAGANPGALIESVMTHSDTGDEVDTGKVEIYGTSGLIHSATDIIDEDLEHKEEGANDMPDKTIGEVLDTLSEEQMNAVTALVANIAEEADVEHTDTNKETDKGGEDMKHNVFNGEQGKPEEILTHSQMEAVITDAKKGGTLKNTMLQHGITNIEVLFPDAHNATGSPWVFKEQNTAGAEIVNSIRKSPFSRIKTIYADFTEEEARAKGYIKGAEKLEQVFELFSRETLPQTIYKKQKLDRDDIIDITDFNVVPFINMEMKMMLIEEIARAVMVGDGRLSGSADKIKETNIRPITKDDDLYTIKKTAATAADMIETVIKAMAEYQGSGSPTLFMAPTLVADLRLLKAQDGRYLFGDIPTKEAIAARLGVKNIVESTFFTDQALIVNLADYTLGATKGGEITNFDDFDIDFNQYKYLIETRLSGALTQPKSAILITVGTPVAEG